MKTFRTIFAASVFCVTSVATYAIIDPALQAQLGNPSGATSDTSNHSHYLISRAQYALDYDDATGEPNWVAWDLTAADHGTVPRSNFIPDPDLPAGFYAVTTADYNGVGVINFNRGHMCPAADRSDTLENNQVVFYMTNILPQSAGNNQGPWEVFETECRNLASAGNEILIISGPSLFGGAKIPSGVADIPNYVWKIAIVVPVGSGSALSRITAATRVIALKMPNVNGIRSNPWTDFIVSVSEIEADTGYRFFTNLPASVADALRAKVDSAGSSGGTPTITTQPASQSVLAGGNATFSVDATGGSLLYQWRKDGDEIAGATNPTFTITNVQATDAGGYDVVVSNANGSITSSVATLTISTPTPPVITTQPANQTVNAGGTATFTVAASGLPAPTFQWSKISNSVTTEISGATGATLVLTNVQATDSGSGYFAVATNSQGPATSQTATLTVTSTPPSITTQPASQTVIVGNSATFTVVATGSAPLTYQWRKNGTQIGGATSVSFTISGAQSSDGGSYDVVVSNLGGTATSNIAVLGLAGVIATNTTQVLYTGGTYTQDFDSLPNSGTFSFTGPGPFYLNNPSSNNTGVNATNLGGWSFAKVTDPGGALSTGAALFLIGTGSATNGSMYSFGAASSTERAFGALLSNAVVSAWGVTIANNTGATISQFTMTYAGEQWRYGAGTNNTTDRIFVEYRVGGTDIVAGTFTATPATLDFNSPVNSVPTAGPTSSGNGNTNRVIRSATITGITWLPGANLVLRWRDFNVGGSDDGLAIDDFAFTTPAPSAVPPTVAVASTSPAANAANASVSAPITVTFNRPVTVAGNWFNITSAAHGPVTASASPATGPSTTFTLTPSTNFDYTDTLTVNLAALQISDAVTGTHPTSDYTFTFGTAAPTPPSITTHPKGQAVVVGGTVNLSVVATGTAPLSYQWRKDGLPLGNGGVVSGATSATLTLTGVTLADAGSYDIVVNNVTNVPVTSAAAVLTVSTTPIAPNIDTPPQSQTVSFGGTVAFTVVANGTTPFIYQWRRNGVNLANGGGVSGATSDTLVVTGVTFASAGNYDVVVSNGTSPNATSAAATLTVNAASGASVLSFNGGTYAQNFNTLPASGSFSFSANGPYSLDASVANGGVGAAGMTGWSFSKYSGTGGNAIFRVDTGSSNSGGTTSYGTGSNPDRALGSLGSGSVVSRFGAVLVNNTGQKITQFTLGYTGEQWRHGGATTSNTLSFTYAVGATDINTGTFVAAPALDFAAPIVTTSSGALDGNTAANRVVIGGQVTGLNWTPGQLLVLRWSDVDDGGADDGIAVDDLTFTLDAPAAPVITTQPVAQTVTAFGNATFTVAATATPAPIYQWRKGGVALVDGGVVAGANSPTLTFTHLTTAAAGDYDVLVSNGIGAPVASNLATLTVNKAAATVTLGNLAAVYDGTPKAATATTSPTGLAVTFTYNADPAAPINAGSYTVVATINDANYTGSATGTLVIAQAASVLTWAAPAPIVFGDPLGAAQLNATANTPGTFTYTPAAGAILNAGANQTLSVSFAPMDAVNFTAASATTVITVNRATATLAWSAPAPITYGTALGAVQLNATAAPIPGAFVYTPAAGTVLNAGASQTLSALFTPANANNFTTADISTTITVNKAAPTISWAPPAPIAYGTALGAAQLNASASTPGTFTYTPAAGTLLNAGANQALSVSFTPTDANNFTTASAATTITVNRATPTLTWSAPAPITYGTPLGATELNATANTAGTFVYTPSAGTVLNAGPNQALAVAFTPDDAANFTSATASTTITVNVATATIAFGTVSATYDGTPKSATATTTPDGLAVTFTYEGNAAPPTNAGAYALVATINDQNYAGSAVGTFTIAQATQTIAFNPVPGVTYGDAPFTVNATAGSGLAVAFSIVSGPATISGSTVTISGAGPVIVRASQAGGTNYSAAPDVDQSFTVGKANQAIAFNPIAGATFGDVPFAIGATANSGLAVSFAIVSGPATLGGSTVTITGVGPVAVRASQAGDANYNPAPNVDQTFTVGKANQAIAFAALADKTYGDAPFGVGATSSSGLPVTFSVANGPATVSGNTVTLTGAGTVILRASQAGDANTNAAPNVDRTFAVAKATLTVTAQNATRAYGATTPALAVAYSGFVGADTATALGTAPTATTTATAASNVGTYPIAAAGGVDANYAFTYASGTLTITPAAATITLGSLGQVYTGAPKAATATTAPAGLAVGFTYNGSATAPTNAGSYAVVATILDANYTGTTSGTLAIAKANATIALGSLTQTYNGTPRSATATTTPAGLTVQFTYDGNAAAPTNAGVYALAATIADANYAGSASGIFIVGKAATTVTLSGLSRTYDGTPKAVTATTAPAGLTVSIAYNGSATAPTIAGSYAVVATVNTANYAGSATGTLTIAAASTTITLGNLSQIYDGTPKSATAVTTPAGLTVAFTYNGSATAPTAPGSYAVVATITDPNYSGSANGTLTISTAVLVRHAPNLNGGLDGSLQVLLPEGFALNGSAWVSGDLLVPGTPTVQQNGHPTYAGTVDGSGAATPSNYTITLNSGAVLRHVVRRTDAVAMPTVSAPPAPTGTRNVSLNSPSDSPGNFATLRDLTLNGNAGTRTIPAGTYGTLTVNGNNGLILGVAGATTPAVYNLQGLTLNGTSVLHVVGPVIVNLANGVSVNGSLGDSGHPEWLKVNVASGGFTLNGNVTVSGFVTAPNGTVTINGNSTLKGGVIADRLTINGNGLLDTIP